MTQAVILVGGQGTRLRPLTCNTPKPMVPVLNAPFLEHVICNLRAHNILDIVLAQHYLAESMVRYFGDGSRFGVRLTYVMEDSPRGTAGAVKNVEHCIEGTFFVLNGDIFHNRDFTGYLRSHHDRKAKATLVLTPVEDPSIYGVVETTKENRVLRFIEKPKREEAPSNWINAGTYVLEPDIFKMMKPGGKYSFEREIFPGLLDSGEPVYAIHASNYWMDTGTPEKYLQLHCDILSGKCDGYSFDKDFMPGRNCRIHKAAKFIGKVILGDNCAIEAGARLEGPVVIGSNCNIGKNSLINDSVIWNDSNVGDDSVLRYCAIANNCTIGSESHLASAVLGDHVTIKPATTLEPNVRVFPEGLCP